ncbi:MAG: UDP-glucose 4-epimerase GalE [Chitinophagales bacterium]
MARILVTGGCGYIGSHTIVDLIKHGYDVISIDNFSNSDQRVLQGIEAITGQQVKNYAIDLTDAEAVKETMDEIGTIDGIIHFAAFKSVPESVAKPLLYYHNNIQSTANVLAEVQRRNIGTFIFSSSCSVYGQIASLPVNENTPLGKAECPYAYTKQIGEQMIADIASLSPNTWVSLRYFNPVGAHQSGLIGEVPNDKPNNLVPRITGRSSGRYSDLTIFGGDYDTRDGTCIRDYIHVEDIAHAHTLALNVSREQTTGMHILNLGSGEGVSVLEAIQAFEKAAGRKLEYTIGPRREGDVMAVYADNSNASRLLQWKPNPSVEYMMSTAWQWEVNMASGNSFLGQDYGIENFQL